MPEKTSEIDISYVAYLARIELSDAEKQRIASQLKDVLAYVEKLNALDVSNVEPTAHATPLSNVMRRDEVRPSIDPEKVFKNAPEHARDLFIVPKIIE
jgi:aspartyl-tRNA(Asn)/glutamyl-tRNA(Gln) amidotransferase subunit C